VRFEASDLYYSKGSLDSKGAPPRLRAEPAAGDIAPPPARNGGDYTSRVRRPGRSRRPGARVRQSPEAAGLDQSSGRASGLEDEVSLNQWITAAIAQKVDAVETAADFLNAGLEMARPKTSGRSSQIP